MFFVYPYKQGSNSAKVLTQALGGKLIKLVNSKFKNRPRHKVINWGSSVCPYPNALNKADLCRAFGNKLEAFKLWGVPEGPRVPEWSVEASQALLWLNEKKTVFCRKSLTGSKGAGIIVLDWEAKEVYTLQDIPQAPLYVKYIPKDHEYRVHIFNGEVIDVQRKVKDPAKEAKSWKVRSHDNGFIFIRKTPQGTPYKEAVEEDIITQAKKAFTTSGILFGAFDVIYNKKSKKAYVLEVNLAPGLEGETVKIYADAFKKWGV